MKKISLLVLALCIVSVISNAQVSFGGGAQAGIAFSSFPKGISDYYGMGFGFGGHGDLNFGKYFTGRLNVDYSMFSSDKDKLKSQLAQANNVQASALDLSGLNISDFGIMLNGLGKLPTGTMVTPYAIVGVGIHIMNISDGKVTYQGQEFPVQTGLGSQTKFGLNFGAGSEFSLGMAKLYFDVKYVIIFTEGNSSGIIPLTFGVTFGG
jgi:hypothetical protein